MRKLAFFLMFLCSLSFLAGFSFKEAKATTLTVSRTFSSLTYDGDIEQYGATYSTVYNSSSGYVVNGVNFAVGQDLDTGTYFIYRGFQYFDTSTLLSSSTMINGTLQLYVIYDGSTADFNVTIQSGQPTYPHIPMSTIDYFRGYYNGDGGSANTSEVTGVGTWINITLTSSGLSWINQTGTTKLCLRSSKDIAAEAPTGSEYMGFGSAETGEAYSAKLTVYYSRGAYRYIVHGPYYESGAVAPCLVNITLAVQNMASNSTFLNGTDGSADTVTFEVEQQGVSLSWNISSSGYNYTRMIRLMDGTFEEHYIFVTDPSEVTNIYSFNFVDLLGVTDAYFETRITFNGSSVILERQIADVFSSKPFWLTWNHHYDVRLVCDQGSYTWSDQVATEPYTWTFAVNSGMFPITLPGMNLTIYAERKNHTYIQVNYSDAESLTSWVNVAFKHKLNGVYVTDYSLNQTGNSVQVNWYSADEEYGYRVLVQYYRNGTTESGYLFVNQLPSDALVFEGQLDLLGLFPFDSRQLIGIFILFIIGTIFTYEDVVIGGFTILILASFLNLIGFLAIGWTLIGVGFIIVFLAALANAKRGTV